MNNNLQMVGVGLIGLGIYLYHQYKSGDKSEYDDSGSYPNMTPLKHDLIKTAITELFPLLFYPILAKEFFNQDDFLNSFVGKLVISLFSFFIYYIVVEPNMANRVRKF